MACIITYKNNKYSQQEFEKYFKNNFNEFVNEFLSQDIEGFKEFIKNQEVKTKESSEQDSINEMKQHVLDNFDYYFGERYRFDIMTMNDKKIFVDGMSEGELNAMC